MRRTLILATILLGIGGYRTIGGTGASTGPLGTATATPAGAPAVHEIAPAAGTSAAAFVRSGPGPLSIVWQAGSGPGPKPLTRRPDPRAIPADLGTAVGSTQATLRVRLSAHRDFGGWLAIERAGRSSSSPTTPPPFRSV